VETPILNHYNCLKLIVYVPDDRHLMPTLMERLKTLKWFRLQHSCEQKTVIAFALTAYVHVIDIPSYYANGLNAHDDNIQQLNME